MNTKQRNLFLKLADFLETLDESKFDFTVIGEERADCGTVACAIGWLPAVCDEVELVPSYDSSMLYVKAKDELDVMFFSDVARRYLGVPSAFANELFCPAEKPDCDTCGGSGWANDAPSACIDCDGTGEGDGEPHAWDRADGLVCDDDATPGDVAKSMRNWLTWREGEECPRE